MRKTTARELSLKEKEHYHDFSYQQDLFAFSDVIWKNILAAIRNAEDPELASKYLIVHQCTQYDGHAAIPPGEFFLKAGAPNQACYENGFMTVEDAEREVTKALSQSGADVKHVAQMLGEWKMDNERYSGFKTLNLLCYDPGRESPGLRRDMLEVLNKAMFSALTASPSERKAIKTAIHNVAKQRNTATHEFRDSFAADTERLREIIEENRKIAALFRKQADPAGYKEAIRKHNIYLRMLDYAPFPIDDLAPLIPNFQEQKEKLRRVIEQNKFVMLEDDRISFCDPQEFVNDLFFIGAVAERESDDLVSMHSGIMDFLIDAGKRPLTKDDLRQMFRHTVTFALPSVWLDRNGQKFLLNQYLPILREQNQQAKQKRTMYLDKMTHRELRPRAEAGEKSAVIARRIRQTMQQEQTPTLEILPPVPQQNTPEDTILHMAEQFPDVRFSVLISPSDYISFAKRVNPEAFPNVITVMIPAAGADSGDLTIPAPAREAAMRCIQGRTTSDHDESAPEEAPDSAGIAAAPMQPSAQAHAAPAQPAEPVAEPPKAPAPRTLPDAQPQAFAFLPYQKPEQAPKSGEVVYDAENAPVRLGERLGSGGEGTIYAVPGAPNLAAKLYDPALCSKERYEKLCWMVQNNPRIPQLCWPQKLLFSGGCFVGFTMQRVPGTALPFQLSVAALSKPAVVNGIMQKWDRMSLARLCERVCATMAAFPEGILMGDVNPNNFLLDIDAPEQVRFWIVDCDSFQVDRWHCPVGTEAFTSPRIFETRGTENVKYDAFFRTREDEDYAVATLLFLILMGSHPYSAIGKTNMVRAIREHQFAYRSTDQQADQTSGRDVPDGPYRLIWSHMPVYLRETFERVFRKGEHVSLQTWADNMRRYRSDMGKGWFDRTVLPNKYFDPTGTTFVDFVCDFCKNSDENMFAAKYERNRRNHEPNLCRACFATLLRVGKEIDDEPLKCSECGEYFNVPVRNRMRYEHGFWEHPQCSACKENVATHCDTPGCRNQVLIRRGYLLSARKDGKKNRCESCREEITTQCQWSQGCSNVIREPRFKMIELRARGKQYRPLCQEHRELLRNR